MRLVISTTFQGIPFVNTEWAAQYQRMASSLSHEFWLILMMKTTSEIHLIQMLVSLIIIRADIYKPSHVPTFSYSNCIASIPCAAIGNRILTIQLNQLLIFVHPIARDSDIYDRR